MRASAMKKRWAQAIVAIGLFAVVSVMLASSWALRRTREVPEFYALAVEQLPSDLEAASRSLEQDVVQLQDAASQLGVWYAAFTDDQINAWLAHHIPLEFPKLLPPGVEAPRILIRNDRVYAAARYQNSHLDTIVSFEVRAELTEHPNVMAIRIENLRAGSLPLPLSRFLRAISLEAAKSDFEVTWDMDETGPVALVRVPSEHPGYAQTPVIVESVMLESGQLLLAGHTGPEAIVAYQPRSPVYQLASFRVGRKSIRQVASGDLVPLDSGQVR